MRNLLLVIFFTFSLSLVAQQNISLLAKLPYVYKLSNVWGYTDETNVEYALVGAEDGLSVVSLANPSNPVEIAKIPGKRNNWREIKTFGDYAYVSSESGDGLLIVDLSPLPLSPSLNYVYKTFTNTTGTCTRAHSLAIDTKGFCYLFGTKRNQETIILDIHTNPMNPVEVGSTGLYYTHDGIVAGDTMFLAHMKNGFIGVYNISDRSNPQFITSFDTPLKFPHNIALSEDAHYLYATDEKTGSFLAAYDVSDFDNIVELDRFQREERHFPMVHNTHMLNGYLVNSYYLEGINIVDAHDPQNLVEVGFYDTTPSDSGYFFKGVWGVYPYFASGIVLASDIEQGLYVFNASYNRASYVSGTVKDAQFTNVLNNVKVKVGNTDITGYTDFSGIYRTGYFHNGNEVLYFSKSGYYDTSFVVSFVPANNQVLDVFMRKKPTKDVVFKVSVKGQFLTGAKIYVQSEDDSFSFTTLAGGCINATLTGESFLLSAGKWGSVSSCSQYLFNQLSDTVKFDLNEGLYDDFSFDNGWTVVGDPNRGGWVRDIPFGTFYGSDTINPAFDVSSDCNGFAFVTGNSKNTDFTYNNVDKVNAELSSPFIDLSLYTQPQLSFYLWFDDYDILPNLWFDDYDVLPNDSAFIMMCNNSEIIYLDTIVGSVYFQQEKWNLLEYDLSKFNFNFSNYKFKITAVDVYPLNALELGIDVFQITEKAFQEVVELSVEEVEIFPNPSSDVVNVNSTTPLQQYEIMDAQGKIICHQKLNNERLCNINVQSLTSGFYFIEFINNENLRFTKKILVLTQ